MFQMLEMETILLKVLNFDLSPPTPSFFCDKFIQETQADDNVRFLAMVFYY